MTLLFSFAEPTLTASTGKILPCLANDGFPHRDLRAAILSGQLRITDFVRAVATACLNYDLLGQALGLAAAIHRVMRILQVGSNIEVRRIAARGVVALVANRRLIRHFDAKQFQCKAMRQSLSATFGGLNCNDTVSFVRGTFPRPACIKATALVDSFPESFWERSKGMIFATSNRTKAGNSDPCRFTPIHPTAEFTGSIWGKVLACHGRLLYRRVVSPCRGLFTQRLGFVCPNYTKFPTVPGFFGKEGS